MDKKNKICFFSGNIERSGGTERVTTLIANELKSRGYDIVILSYEDGKKSYFNLNKDITLYTLINNSNSNRIKKQFYPSYLLYKFIKKQKIDLIIDVDILLSIYTIPLKVFTNIKIISWEHFNLRSNNGVKKRDLARLLASKFSDKIIVLNKKDKQAYKNKFRNISNINYIYNPSSFRIVNDSFEKKQKKVLAVGRLTKQKGFDLLLKAWSQVELENKEWDLQIVGSGEEHKELENIIEKMHLKNVEIILFSDSIDDYYREASLYVMSSRYEGFPMVLLEAQAFALPIISFDCETGPNEIIRDGIDGVLIENGNVEIMAESINELINDPFKLKEYSINARENSKGFTVKKIVDKWEKMIRSI